MFDLSSFSLIFIILLDSPKSTISSYIYIYENEEMVGFVLLFLVLLIHINTHNRMEINL